MPSRIEDYALIGDCETAALVSRDGSIDWLCWPRFDSGACFAALLGGPEHGRWLIAPKHPAPRITRRYREHTLILETDFETPEGAVTVVDFMPLRGHASDLVRIVIGRRGRVEMRMELILRFDYGAFVPWVTRLEDGALRAIAGPDMVVPPHRRRGARRGPNDGRRLRRERGRLRAVRADVHAIAPAAAGAGERAQGARRHRAVLEGVVGSGHAITGSGPTPSIGR